MAIFTKTGNSEKDFWLADGNIDFSILPANTIVQFDKDIPIRLHVGNIAYGEIHIIKHWAPHKLGLQTIPGLIYAKLGQGGTIYCTEVEKKIKITMNLNPSGLMILEQRYYNYEGMKHDYLSVTSFYGPKRSLDGIPIGRYQGRQKIIIPLP